MFRVRIPGLPIAKYKVATLNSHKKTLGGSCMKNELRDICVRLSGYLDQAKGFQVLKAELKDGRWYLEVERIDEESTDESNE